MDRYLGDISDDAEPVTDATGAVVAWDVIKGYFAPGNWKINIVCATKDEAIWLTRCCQYFICLDLMELERKGLIEASISVMDMQPSPGQAPMNVCCRAINLTGKVTNSWKVRILAESFALGINAAL